MPFSDALTSLRADYTPAERRNLVIYIAGIMLYKFGLEAFNGSILALATNRYDFESHLSGDPSRTFQRIGLLTGLNQAFQCVGSILIAPLVKRFAVKNVLCVAVTVFALLPAILLILDAATGGTFIPDGFVDTLPENDFSYYGRYKTDGMIPVYAAAGAVYGMVELVRRVIPRDIVGGDVRRLRRMDAAVHVFYEIAGTAGAFTTGLALIPRLGTNRAFIVTPICFGLAGVIWYFLATADFTIPATSSFDEKVSSSSNSNSNSTTTTTTTPVTTPVTTLATTKVQSYLSALSTGLILFFKSLYVGFLILVSSRRFIWLIPGYAIGLYAHRYLETGLAPQIARRYLGNSGWAQIMVGGSNIGELLGALAVFLLGGRVPTPIPWLRLDALMLLVVWYIPYWTPPSGQVGQAWVAAATFIPVSFGWAAGDVSLAAYIQASLTRLERREDDVSALGAVMAFLYSFYVVTYAILGPVLGSYLDGVYTRTGGSNGGDISKGLVNTAGLQFTFVFILMFASTFVPKGSSAFNPKMLFNDPMVDVEERLPRAVEDENGRRELRPDTSSTALDREKRIEVQTY